MENGQTLTRYLITGGAGFLGSHVVDLLSDGETSEIVVPRSADVDLTRQEATESLVEGISPDVIIHLAAEVGGIGANQANPGRYFYANAVMGINLIEAARHFGVQKFVQVGTVCSYPKRTEVPFVERDLWDGFPEVTNAPYGIAKRGLLVMLQAYRNQYGLNGIYLLPANLYGPHDNFDLRTSHVIPALIRRFVTARRQSAATVTLWGTGSPSREFLHVRDAARGIVSATVRYNEPEPVNLGTGTETTISELADLIAGLAGYEGEIQWDTSKPDGQPRRSLDVSRAKQVLGFKAEIALSEGLQETIAWWKRQADAHHDMNS